MAALGIPLLPIHRYEIEYLLESRDYKNYVTVGYWP